MARKPKKQFAIFINVRPWLLPAMVVAIGLSALSIAGLIALILIACAQMQ